MTAPVLRIAGLTKSFRGRRVVDGVDMSVGPGKIVGFLGPNGAGKTSVMTMIMGLMNPDQGEITLFGETGKHAAARLRMGYLQEKPRLYPEMSARAYLTLFARLHGVARPADRVDVVLERVGLTAAANRPLGSYSRGMQQRASIARVMLHGPEFLILDEPTLGLDPRGVADMRDIFTEMRAEGTALLFSSHQLAEIERICDTVVFLSQGRVLAAGTPAELLPAAGTDDCLTIETAEPIQTAARKLSALPGVVDVCAIGTHKAVLRLSTPLSDAQDRRAVLSRGLIAVGLTPLSVGAAQSSLEDLFLTLAGPRPETGD